MTTLPVPGVDMKNKKKSDSLERRSLLKSLFDVRNVQFAFRTTFKRRQNGLRSCIVVTGLGSLQIRYLSNIL